MTAIPTTETSQRASLGWRSALVAAICAVVEWLFVLVVAVLPIDAYIFLPGKQSGLFLSEALTTQAVVLLAVGYLLARWWRLPFPLSFPLRLLAPLACLLGVSAIAIVFAHSRSTGLRGWAQYLFFFAVFLLAIAVARQEGVRNRVFWALLIGFYVVVILGLLGTLTTLPDFAQIILNVQRVPATLPGALTPRAESSFRFPDELNAYLLLMLPFLTACAFTVRSRVERVVFGVFVALGLWLLFLTYARSALIILVVITPLLLYFLGGLRVSLLGVVVVVFGLGIVLARDATVATRSLSLLNLNDVGYSSRLQTWSWALDAFTHHPLFGVGPRNLQFWPNAPYADAFRHRLEDNGENSYINTLAELGIAGFAALVFCIVAGARRLWSGLADRSLWLSRSWHVGFLAGFCALLLDSLAHSTITSTQVTALLCALIGLAGPFPLAAVEESTLVERAAEALKAPRRSNAPLRPVGALAGRVVFLINSPSFGGAESHSVNLAIELHRRGVRVLVVCPPESPLPPLLAANGVPCRRMALGMPIGRIKGALGSLNYLLNPFSRSRFQRALLALAIEEPSMFVCPFPREQLLATPLCRQLDIPVIWIIHTPMAYLPHRLLLQWRWNQLARQATAVATVSPGFAERLGESGFPSERLRILPSATPSAQLMQPASGAARATPGKLVIVSRLRKTKGIQYALDALPQILERHPEAHLDIVGAGNYEAALRRHARRLGVQGAVTFVGYQAAPQTTLRQAQALLYPTVDRGEVFPAAILEALGLGIPVVASSIASIPEVVQDGKTGMLVWPGDSRSLADAVCSLLDNPQAASAMGMRGYELVRARYTFERTGDLLLRLLQSVETGAYIDAAPLAPEPALRVSAEIRAIHRPQLIGATGLFTVARVLTAFATALWTILAARALAPTSYGNLMLAASLAELAGIITDAGVTSVATRELAQARTASEVRQLTRILVYLKVALGLAATLVTVVMGFVLPYGAQTHLLLLVLSPGLLFVSLNSLTLVFRAQMRFPIVVRIAFVVATVNILTALVAYVVRPTAMAFALADLAATVVAGVMTAFLIYRIALRGRLPGEQRLSIRSSLAMTRSLLASSLMLGLSLTLNIFYVRIDVPLLAFLTNSAQVATYTSAYRVIDVISLLPVSAAGAALPLMASLGQQDRERLRAFTQQYLDIAVVVGLFIALALTLVGRDVILVLFGARYSAAAPVLMALSWAGAAMFVTNVFSPLAVALDHRRALLLSGAVGLAVNVGFNLLLIPKLGPVGPAWATLLTELAVTALLATVSLRSLRWRPDPYTMVAAIEATGAALLTALVTHALAGWESDALALVVWAAALTLLAPGWVFALARSLRSPAWRTGARRTEPWRSTSSARSLDKE